MVLGALHVITCAAQPTLSNQTGTGERLEREWREGGNSNSRTFYNWEGFGGGSWTLHLVSECWWCGGMVVGWDRVKEAAVGPGVLQ